MPYYFKICFWKPLKIVLSKRKQKINSLLVCQPLHIILSEACCPCASVPNNIFMESDFCPGRCFPTCYPFSFQHFCFQGWHSHCWHYTWLMQAWKWFKEWIFTFSHQWKMPSGVWSERSPHAGEFADWILTWNMGITYKAQATHGCCSPHFLLLHQHHLTGKKTAASSWSEAGRSVPAASPADGSFERPCRPTPSAPAPLAPAAPFVPCGFHCSGPAFHPKHIKRHKLEVQLPNWSLGKTLYNHKKFLYHLSTSIR